MKEHWQSINEIENENRNRKQSRCSTVCLVICFPLCKKYLTNVSYYLNEKKFNDQIIAK